MSIEDLLEEYRDNDYYNLHKIENITKLCEEIKRLNNIINEEEIKKTEIKKTEISYYRQQELLEKLKEFKEIPELIKQVERLESMLKNDLIIYM